MRNRSDGRGLLVIAVVAAVVTVAVLVLAFVRDAGGRHGPAGRVADAYMTALAQGDGQAAFDEVSPFFRTVVLVSELDLLADAIADVVGDGVEVNVVGTERTSGTTILAGYQASTDAGTMEGVVTLVEDQGRWWVQDASYRFPEADDEVTETIDQVVARLNEQIASRLSQ